MTNNDKQYIADSHVLAYDDYLEAVYEGKVSEAMALAEGRWEDGYNNYGSNDYTVDPYF